jgi:hypothetical protein
MTFFYFAKLLLGLNKGTRLIRAQRDSNPRPAAPQAAILSKLNYGPPAMLRVYYTPNKSCNSIVMVV